MCSLARLTFNRELWNIFDMASGSDDQKRDEVLRNMLNTPPEPHSKKKTKVKKKKRVKRSSV